jgi:glycosyltransferase involved in cell wall biosynthesis
VAEVSAIIPAHDAAATLGRTLDALAAQDFAGDVEVVVVDDASTDATAALASARGVRVVVNEGENGPAGARNAGLAATTAPLVAFTDADCEPAPGWLSALVAALRDADLVLGPVEPDPRVSAGPFDRTLKLTGPSPRFETANLAVRREVADAVGGFEAFRPDPEALRPGIRPRPDQGHFGEDALFGWRAVARGARVAFAPDALVHHAVFPRGPAGYLRERWRLRFFPALVRDVPAMRTRMFGRVFMSRRSALFDLAVLGVCLAVGRRRALPLLLVLPYARTALWRSPIGLWLLRTNAVLVAGDAIACAALVRGSVAARRPLI